MPGLRPGVRLIPAGKAGVAYGSLASLGRLPDDLLAVAADDVAQVSLDPVDPFTAIDVLRDSIARVDQVVAVAAEEAVDAGATFEVVPAGVAPEDVIAVAADQDVVAVLPVDAIPARLAVDEVGAAAAEDLVVAGATVHDVAPFAGEHSIVAPSGEDSVGPNSPADQIVVGPRAKGAALLIGDLAEGESPIVLVDVVGEVAVRRLAGCIDLALDRERAGRKDVEQERDVDRAAGRERRQCARSRDPNPTGPRRCDRREVRERTLVARDELERVRGDVAVVRDRSPVHVDPGVVELGLVGLHVQRADD